MVERCKHEYQKPKLCFSKMKVFSKSENSFMKRQVNQECVCDIYLSNPPTIYPLHFTLKQKNKILYLDTSLHLLEVFTWRLLILLTWSKHDPTSSTYDVVLMHRLVNQPVIALKYDFKSFVEAPHLLRSWSNNLSLIKHKIISNITSWVNHHQN